MAGSTGGWAWERGDRTWRREVGREAEDKEEVPCRVCKDAALEHPQRRGEQGAEDGATSAEDTCVACALLRQSGGGRGGGVLPGAGTVPGAVEGSRDRGRNRQGGREPPGRQGKEGGQEPEVQGVSGGRRCQTAEGKDVLTKREIAIFTACRERPCTCPLGGEDCGEQRQ